MGEDVTLWLDRFLQGDQDAVQPLWDRYYAPLLRLARRKLGAHARRSADEEDVALSAFNSFCRAATAGRFAQLDDHHDLWRLLVTITARKASAQLKRQFAQKRGAGQVHGESVFGQRGSGAGDSSSGGAGIGAVAGGGPTPELDALVREECRRLLDSLGDEALEQVALKKLEGYTNEEIARDLGCAVATVERKLARIRKIWQPVRDAGGAERAETDERSGPQPR